MQHISILVHDVLLVSAEDYQFAKVACSNQGESHIEVEWPYPDTDFPRVSFDYYDYGLLPDHQCIFDLYRMPGNLVPISNA